MAVVGVERRSLILTHTPHMNVLTCGFVIVMAFLISVSPGSIAVLCDTMSRPAGRRTKPAVK